MNMSVSCTHSQIDLLEVTQLGFQFLLLCGRKHGGVIRRCICYIDLFLMFQTVFGLYMKKIKNFNLLGHSDFVQMCTDYKGVHTKQSYAQTGSGLK